MFHQAHLFPVISLPPTAPAQQLTKIHHSASAYILPIAHHEKPSLSKESTCIASGKSIKLGVLPFERDFKRKYHSVCSRVVKIKQAWRQDQQEQRTDQIHKQQQQNRCSPLPEGKFYERAGSGLIKGYNHAQRTKIKSRYNSRPSYKPRQSLKIDDWRGMNSKGYSGGKLHTLYEKQARLERELTVDRKSSVANAGNRRKVLEERRGVSLNETIDLRGWNHFEEIRQDDLLQSA